MPEPRIHQAARFIRSLEDPGTGAFRSVPGGPVTLYGTAYGLLALHYLGIDAPPPPATRNFLLDCQDPDSGLFIGPELHEWSPPPGALHDRQHLLLHLTCATLPVARQFNLTLRHPLHTARNFCNLDHLRDWLEARDLRKAWFEGNNLLFVGQLLVHLRDVETVPEARIALDLWFEWLDRHLDPATNLWGTNGLCSPLEGVYGGYHQLLVYDHENRPLPNPAGLIDTVLDLQHPDGGFHPWGNAGACEDVDAVDILVRLHPRTRHRHREIRIALRRCLRHILDQQNPDGGFPYQRDAPQSHMGIPATRAAPNLSAMFPTWFRIHTLALLARVLTDEPELQVPFRFSRTLSMGWHRHANAPRPPVPPLDRALEAPLAVLLDARRFLRRIRRGLARRIRQRLSPHPPNP
ncbi:MAG: hypothetical protein KF833_22780 [Verrucomicrobiae bacterium]|nr:hypothetical protein [Verrucomicrobiae bacterium]